MIEDLEWRKDKETGELVLFACDLSGRWFEVPIVERGAN